MLAARRAVASPGSTIGARRLGATPTGTLDRWRILLLKGLVTAA